MTPTYLTVKDESTLLSKAKKMTTFSQGLFVRFLFQIIVLFSIVFTTSNSIAAPIITNTASASYTVNGNNLNLSDSVQFERDAVVVPTDTIELAKISNVANALIGDTISYTLTVTNPNSRTLTGVSVEDTLPAGLIYQTGSAQIDNVVVATNNISLNNNIIEFTIGSMPANTSLSLTYQANIGATTPEGNALNRAIVNSDTATSPIAQANVVVSEPVIVAPLILNKTVNLEDVSVGDTVRYSLSIENNNDFIIAGAVVNDVLPAGVQFVAGSAQYNNNAITATVNNGLNFDLGNIAANSSSVLIYDATINTSVNINQPLINTAQVTANDPQANSNTSTATVNIVDDTIQLTKATTSTDVVSGDVVDYTLTLTNPLTRNLTGLNVVDTLPTGFVYIAGSASIDNTNTNNVSVNGNILNFNIGSLAASTSIVITYQVQVNDNAIPGDAINTAQANSQFAGSPFVTAVVNVRTPSTITFFRIDDTGVGSIIQPTTFNTNQNGGNNFEAITNVTLLNGSTVNLPMQQPIVAANQYTLDEPIVIEVMDLDQNLDPNTLDTILVTVNVQGTNDTEILTLTETALGSGKFRGILPTTSSNTNIQNGILSIAEGENITVSYRDEEDSTDTSATAALVVPETNLSITKTADKTNSAIGELVRYKLEFSNPTGFNLSNLTVNDLLPLGFRYIPNTATLNGTLLNQGVNANGKSIIFNLNNMPVGSTWTLEYVTKISAGVRIGDAINTAFFTSGSLRSNDAQAVVKIRDDLLTSRNILTGRVYIGCTTKSDKNKKAPKVLGEARIYMETGRSVLTDAEGFWHMEGVNSGAHVLQLDTESIPGYEPLLCKDNTRHAQDAKSQFIDLERGNLWHVDFHVKPIEGYVPTKTKLKENKPLNPAELFGKKYLETATDDFEILWPKNNYVPAIASTKVYIKHSPKHKLELFLNGKKINGLNYDGSDTSKDKSVIIRRWLGVDIDIKKKDNTLLAVLKDKSGKEISRKTHNIHFSGQAASAKFVKEESILIADGKTSPVITLRIKDEDGFPMRANTSGYFTIMNNKYSVKTHNTNDNTDQELNPELNGDYKYDIGENGLARIELNPTTQSGEVKLKLQFIDEDRNRSTTEISAWLKPALRDWILVGLAEGSAIQELVDGNKRHLTARDKEPDFGTRGRVAFFAKGKIQGKYLLTVAYDSHKTDREVGSQLNGNIDPDAYYTIYADNSNSQFEAPSSEKLYLKIERENFYALFGDYESDLTITELAKYQRTLNGIKTEYNGDRLSYNAFVSETSNNHERVEIPGDGTSGLYRLNNNIIPNSESITIETRDRFRSDRIIEERVLTRFQDYDIDYNDGTLFFKFPIVSRDRDFNPNIIVVNYDTEEDTNKSITAGGRVAVKSKGGKLEVGVSLIHEGQNNTDDNQLIASDLTYKITKDTTLKAEIAQSKTVESNFEKRNAYILELEKQIQNMEARLYYKKQDSEFGIDSQNSEIGTEKVGAELNYRVNDKTRFSSDVSIEKNLDNNNERRLAQVEVSHKIKQVEVSAGFRHSQEELENQNNVTEQIDSNTLLLGGQYTTKNNKVTLRTNLEKNIDEKNGSEISPDRFTVGVDVKITKDFSVFAENETTDNGDIRTNNTRVGVSRHLWKGAKARTTYVQERTDEAQRNYATLGLSQTVKLSDKITADLSIDQGKTISSNNTQLRFNEDEPVIQGAENDDFTAFSVGLGASDKDWSWTTRAEYRNGEQSDRVNFLASVVRHYENGKSLSARLNYHDSDFENGEFDRDINLSFGSAWHPKEKDFVLFTRLDLESEKSSRSSIDSNNGTINTNNNDTQRIVHNLHYNRKINDKTQIGIHHGIKYVRDENNGVSSSSTIDTGTVKIRRDINKRWDIGVHGGYLRDWTADATEYVAGASVGFTPKKNLWIELGYNVEGFKDEDFDNNNFTSEGVYLDFRYKFNQDTLTGDLPIRRKPKS